MNSVTGINGLYRGLLYVAVGWLLTAAVAGLGKTLGITVMLPATSAALLIHMVFRAGPEGHPLEAAPLPADLAAALALGYLEDLHQGLPTGTLTLAYGLTLLAMRWADGRLSIRGPIGRAAMALVACALIDLITWAVLLSLSGPLGLPPGVLDAGLATTHWHALATMLATPAIWAIIDGALRLSLRVSRLLQRPSAPVQRIAGRRPPPS